MTIYEKICDAKLALQNAGLKKSGKNTFANYDYFELSDFLPTIIKLEHEMKFMCAISFDKELATLSIIDCESPAKVDFTSPMASANLKGMHDVQNMGAVQTYIRRYLYVNAFEIVESDALDGTATKPASTPPVTAQKVPPMEQKPVDQKPANHDLLTVAQRNEIGALCETDDDKVNLKNILKNMGYQKLAEVKQSDFNRLMDQFTGTALPFNI